MTIGELLKKARLDAGMTQKELAEKCGMADSAIRKYESGKVIPKINTVKKIAAALNVPWYELYPGEEDGEDVKILFHSVEEEAKNTNYRERLDSASAYISTLQFSAEQESEIEWTVEAQNNWIKKRLPEVAQRFNVKESDLDDKIYWNFAPEEKWLNNIHEAVLDKPIKFKSLEKICRALMQLSGEGQEEAAKRVEELAKIPDYQRPAEPAGDGTQSADDKEPDKK